MRSHPESVNSHRYRGIRVPVLPRRATQGSDADQPLFMTIDMELKLVKQIQSGSAEQLEELIDQIKKSISARKQPVHLSPYHRNSAGLSVPAVFQQRQKIRKSGDSGRLLKRFIWKNRFCTFTETRALCASLQEKKEEAAVDLDREKISAYIEENLGDARLNFKRSVRMA